MYTMGHNYFLPREEKLTQWITQPMLHSHGRLVVIPSSIQQLSCILIGCISHGNWFKCRTCSNLLQLLQEVNISPG